MITNPIIPIWLMCIICAVLCFLILYDKSFKEKISNKLNNEKTDRQNQLLKRFIINSVIKILIVILIFVINLRPMVPNGENVVLNSDLGVLFVIDTSVSMRALDYNGNKERMDGIKEDCCHIVDELSGCKFSIITFGSEAKRVIPFTDDSDMVQAEIKAIQVESDNHAKGTSINTAKECLEKTLKTEKDNKNVNRDVIVFFITDGEITKEGEQLTTFANLKEYVSGGAVLGYGTTQGGKMVNSTYEDEPQSDNYYIYYYDDNYKKQTAISKLDENNLNRIAGDLGIEYIRMDRTDKVSNKLKDIKKQALNSQSSEKKIKSYQDIYYYFAIPLVILLIVNLIVQKRRI